MKSERIERLLKLIQIMQSGRSYDVDTLADEAGVSRRTVFRDLNLLTQAGIPFVYDRANQRYRIEQSVVLPPLSLTLGEALAYLLAVRHALDSPALPQRQQAAAAALKIEGLLPPNVQDFCGPLLEGVESRPGPASDTESIVDMLDELQRSLAERVQLHARYDSYLDERVIEGILHPYRLAYIHRAWYVIGRWESTEPGAADPQVKTFKVERFVQIKRLMDHYRMDPDFSLDSYFGNAWLMIRGDTRHAVKVRFDELVAGNVEEVRWHRTQRTHRQADGSLIFEVDVDGLKEIVWWILGYGDRAEVLEPPELRAMVAQHAERMLAYYRGEGSPDAGDPG
jgi:predicted DNA-binding transcriptional regulator YafY